MLDLIRYEPYFGKYIFSHQGDLYFVDWPIEQEDGALIITQTTNPYNGLSVPTKVQIQITNRCNLNCPHCYVSSGKITTTEMSDQEIRILLEECQKVGVLQIQWSGGDPFMRKSFISMIQYAHSLGFEQDILTNGIAMGRNTKLAKRIWEYIHSVQISINGYGENFDAWVGKNTWETVVDCLKYLVAEKPPHGRVSVATTLDKQNIADLESTGVLLSEIGVDSWVIAQQVCNGRSTIDDTEANELLATSYETLQKMRSGGISLPPTTLHPFDKEDHSDSIFPAEWITETAARTFLYVSSNGDVYPFPYYDGHTEWMSGNIRKTSIVDLWNSESFTQMRAVTRKDTGCGGCEKICRLWSRWFNYGRKMDIYEPPIKHPTCTYR